MNSLHALPKPVVDADTTVRVAAQRLRNTLRINAGISTLTGLVLLAAPGRLADLIGTGHPGWIRFVGTGLVLFAADVAAVAGARLRRLLVFAPAVIAADIAWVVATIGTVAARWFNPAGVAVVADVGVVIATLGWRQTVHWRRTRRLAGKRLDLIDESPPIEVFRTAGPVPAPARDVWAVITDHDLYGRLAPNLSGVRVLTGNGPDLVRTCSNTKGQTWTETCTLWDDGHRFDVDVHTDGYPYPLQVMRGSWWVEPDGAHHSIAGMDFLLQPRSGLRGRLFAAAMQAAFPFVLRRILRGWRTEAVHRARPAASVGPAASGLGS